MIVVKYEAIFHELDGHATSILDTKYKIVHSFVRGLGLFFYMSTQILVSMGRSFAEVYHHV